MGKFEAIMHSFNQENQRFVQYRHTQTKCFVNFAKKEKNQTINRGAFPVLRVN